MQVSCFETEKESKRDISVMLQTFTLPFFPLFQSGKNLGSPKRNTSAILFPCLLFGSEFVVLYYLLLCCCGLIGPVCVWYLVFGKLY